MLLVNQLIGFGAGGGVATPDEIATLWGWWAPDSMNGTTTLTSWTDKSGNARTLTPQGSNPGKGADGPNGLEAVDLDTASVNINERLEGTESAANLNSYHVFAVMRIDTYGATKWGVYGDSVAGTSSKSPIRSNSAGDRIVCSSIAGGVTATATWSAAAPAAGSWALCEGFVESGVEVGVNVNNGTAVTTGHGTTDDAGQLDGITLGANGAGTSDAMDCSFSELIVYPTRLTAAQRAQVVDYLVDKYGAIGSW